MKLSLNVTTEGLNVAQERAVNALLPVFEACLMLVALKTTGYGEAWRKQGWAGNVARVMSKSERLKHMLWRETPKSDDEETALDTMHDLINITAFAALNFNDDNRWGDQQ